MKYDPLTEKILSQSDWNNRRALLFPCKASNKKHISFEKIIVKRQRQLNKFKKQILINNNRRYIIPLRI